MRAVLQSVTNAHVDVVEPNQTETVGAIKRGFMVLLGVGVDDTDLDAEYISNKIANLRIFEDENGKLNHSIGDINGSVLLISQFTLYADTKHGRRPSFSEAAKPDHAKQLYNKVRDLLVKNNIRVETGKFQAHMQVYLCNNGPITLILDSKK